MITYVKGNLFNCLPQDKKNVVLHIVNDGGAMGSGFARAAFERYPQVRSEYIKWYQDTFYNTEYDQIPFKLGQIQPIVCTDNLTIVNMVGQSDPGGHYFDIQGQRIHLIPFRPDSFRECMYRVLEMYQGRDINLISPLMGCGLSGSTKEIVFGIVDEVLKNILDITVYEL